MDWLVFYLWIALHVPVVYLVYRLAHSWPTRVLLWALLPLPIAFYCKDYFVIKKEHEIACRAQGGLRVIEQPTPSDGIRLLGKESALLKQEAEYVLDGFYPSIAVVETATLKKEYRYSSKSAALIMSAEPEHFDYVRYETTPNPNAGKHLPGSYRAQPKYRMEGAVIAAPAAMYELRRRTEEVTRGIVWIEELTKNGKVFARYSTIRYSWGGIRYPDATPTWTCPEKRSGERELINLLIRH